MRVPLPLLFMLLMLLVIFAVYDILKKSYDVHYEANRRVAAAVLEGTLLRANAGLNDIASHVASQDRPLHIGPPEILFRESTADLENLANRTLFLGFDSEYRIREGRIGRNGLSGAALSDLVSQPAFSQLFTRQTTLRRQSNSLLVTINNVAFILSDPQTLRALDQKSGSVFLVVGLPVKDVVFDELKKYEVFESGALKDHLAKQDDVSGLTELIVDLQDKEYAQFHFSAVAQIFILLVAFIIAIMIGKHIDQKNDDLRQSRDVIAKRQREAQRLREIAEQANQAKSNFIHNMSHELRTPLNAILGNADLMKAEAYGELKGQHERYKTAADSIHKGGMRLLVSISQVLEYSSLIDDGDRFREETVDLGDILFGLGSHFQDRLELRNITLDTTGLQETPLLRADRGMMRALFENLISNAIEFSEDGGSITIASAVSDEGQPLFSISDRGKGMDPVLQNRAFEPFVQGENVYARQHQGLGLGLTLAKTYAKYHGAKIDIESMLGEGTTVTVAFPSERIVTGSDSKNPSQGKARSVVDLQNQLAARI